jgi:eukaryotic-like serine/threonine-protein kinase
MPLGKGAMPPQEAQAMDGISCPKCGQPNAEFNLHCSSCGAPLPASVSAPLLDTHPVSHGVTEGEAPGAAFPPSPSIGQSVSHYMIHELLGRGGMGLVYRATDTLLRRPVALKFLAAPLAQDPRAKARFVREAQAASALDHPNIGTIFEIGETDSSTSGQPFIAMALYEGETLRQRLGRGTLPLAEALAILSQITSALFAAHEAGIVHRDLKPANVMLTRSGQVKILDFGLAKLVSGSVQADASSTEAGRLLGTVGYMSPEQARGRPVDHRTDLWSLGVVAYEMLAGRQPFEAETPVATLSRILTEQPRPLPELRPEAPEWLHGLVAQLLSKEPERRPSSAREVTRSLERGGLDEDLASEPARRAVAVLGFKNLSGRPETAWLSVAFSEMLGTELAAAEELRVIPGEEVARMKIELSLAEADSFGKETLLRIRRNLGTDLVVPGSYLALGEKSGGKIRVDFRLQDTALGETLASVAETGTEEDLFDLVSRVGARLLARCFRPGRGAPRVFELVSRAGMVESPALDPAGARALLPTSPQAARLYAEGLARLRLFDMQGARELLEKAAAAEPGFPLVHGALAEAWKSLGYDARAQEEAKQAFELAAGLPRAERLSIEAGYREAMLEWDRAIEIYRMLWDFFPDQIDYGLRLAAAQCGTGRGRDALATVEALRRRPSPAPDDPRIDLAEADAAAWTSDYQQMQAAAARAARTGQAQGARLLVAAARMREGKAFHRLGRLDEAMQAWEEAQRILVAAGDQRQLASVLYAIGKLCQDQQNRVEARRRFEEVLAISQAIGDKRGVAIAALMIGYMLAERGDFGEARKMCVEALANYREIDARTEVAAALAEIALIDLTHGDPHEARRTFDEALAIARGSGQAHLVATLLTRFAYALEVQGHMAEARRMLDESLAIAREIGAQGAVELALHVLADLLHAQGDLDGAGRRLREAHDIARATGNKNGMAGSLHRLGYVLLARGDFEAARRSFYEARAIRIQMGRESYVPIALARLTLEEGRFAEAEAAARQLAGEFTEGGWIQDELAVRPTLAQALLAQGKIEEAREAIARAQALGVRVSDRRRRLAVEVVAESVRGAAGRPEDAAAAIERLEALHSELAEAGFAALELEARLALGEIELAAGRLEQGRARLEALEKEASARGFGLIARKAASGKARAGVQGHDAP